MKDYKVWNFQEDSEAIYDEIIAVLFAAVMMGIVSISIWIICVMVVSL